MKNKISDNHHQNNGIDTQNSKQQKNVARQRINNLLDNGSFEEIDFLAQSPFLPSPLLTDGVITGFGTIQGKQVALYSQDFSIKGGSLGKRHAEKICKIMDKAALIGCPIIGILDSGGARIDEGIHALEGYASIFARNTRYSGVIPQISLVLGPCAGGAAYSPALTDFVFMAKDISNMFITGPHVIEQVLHQKISKNDLGGTDVHSQQSGVAHVICDNEADMMHKVKHLLSLIPHNYLETSSCQTFQTIQEEDNVNLESLVPSNKQAAYDIKKLIAALSDNHIFFELQEDFAPNIVTAFTRIGEQSIGIVANQPLHKAGTIDINASCKAARFINFCNNFDIPLVSLVDVPGYLPGVEEEHNGIIRHGAKLLYAYAQATVPKITIILRKAFGGAYIVMGSKQLGADFNFAWPNAHIAVLGAPAGVSILHRKTLAKLNSEEQIKKRHELELEYTEKFLNPYTAAQYGYIDNIIEPNKTKQHIISALNITKNKVETLPKKKYGNIPL